MEINKFVVFEGIDGTGKTTLAKSISRRLKGSFLKPPPPPINSLREFYDACGILEARYFFYLSGIALLSQQVKNQLAYNSVFVDRYIGTTISYHKVMGIDPSLVDISKLSILIPHHCICLTAHPEVRLSRIRNRDGEEVAKEYMKKQAFLEKVESVLLSFADYVIDTSSLTAAEVEESVARVIL